MGQWDSLKQLTAVDLRATCGGGGGRSFLNLKLNTMQLETPGGNHCCLMDVQNLILVHSFINIDEHDKQKTIVY